MTALKISINTGLFFFLTFCCIITPISGIIDHYCIIEKKLRTIYPKNHENFTNSQPKVQFYLLLQKKCIFQVWWVRLESVQSSSVWRIFSFLDVQHLYGVFLAFLTYRYKNNEEKCLWINNPGIFQDMRLRVRHFWKRPK